MLRVLNHFVHSSVDKKKSSKSEKSKDKIKDKDRDVSDVGRKSRKDGAEKIVRPSRSRERVDRRQKSPVKSRYSSRRSRSRSVKKLEKSKLHTPSPKHGKRSSKTPDRSRDNRDRRRTDEGNHKDQRSRSSLKQRDRSPSPKKVVKRKSPTPKRIVKESRRSRSLSKSPVRRRSISPKTRKRDDSHERGKRQETRNTRRRSPSPKKRSVERKRSMTPKRHSPERRKERSPEKRRARSPSPLRPVRRRSPSPARRRSPSPVRRRSPSPARRRSLSRDRQVSRNVQRRSSSKNRNQQRRKSPRARQRSASKSRSPVQRKVSRFSRSPAPRNQRGGERKIHNDRKSRSRSLSYSPARRNPEKYRDILDTKSSRLNDKNRKPAPVVKLHPTTSDRDSSDEIRGGSKSIDKVDEFLQIDRNQDKELSRLKALKSELAVKAKESLEKKIISESASTSSAIPGKTSSGRNVTPPQNMEPMRAREMEIVAQTVAISTKEKQAAIKEREDKKKITIKPFKINDSSPIKNIGEVAKNDVPSISKPVEKPTAEMAKGRKPRSHSRSSHR